MAAPRDIVDSLESVVCIYFSDVRHKHRAAFILQDELVEMTCKARARAAHPNLGRITFVPLLKMPAVGLDPITVPLGVALEANHLTRNQLQHVNAALSVDDQHCADAILDAVGAIEHCFPGASAALADALKIALRVVRLHSSQGNVLLRSQFEDKMRDSRWNPAATQRAVRRNEITVAVGNRRHWGLIMLPNCYSVETLLNEVGVPPWP